MLTFITDVTVENGLRWRLDGPDGENVIPERGLWIDLGPGTLPVDGTYSLVIRSIDESAGNYSYRTRIE